MAPTLHLLLMTTWSTLMHTSLGLPSDATADPGTLATRDDHGVTNLTAPRDPFLCQFTATSTRVANFRQPDFPASDMLDFLDEAQDALHITEEHTAPTHTVPNGEFSYENPELGIEILFRESVTRRGPRGVLDFDTLGESMECMHRWADGFGQARRIKSTSIHVYNAQQVKVANGWLGPAAVGRHTAVSGETS